MILGADGEGLAALVKRLKTNYKCQMDINTYSHLHK